MVTAKGTLIVGAGQAAVEVASALRKGGDGAPITILGAEGVLPYQRPPLSKQFLTGDIDAQALLLRAPTFYEQNDITVVPGTRVTRISLNELAVGGVAATDAGEDFAFERLVLATGARPRRLLVPGADYNGVRYLRDLADAAVFRSELQQATNVVVVGGGFIGLEAAAVASTMGKRTYVVEAGPRLLGRIVAPVVSDFYRDAHTRRGVDVRLASEVMSFEGQNWRVSGVLLADGSRLPADLVLIGIGAEPRTELACATGIHCDNGIVVDDHARTNRPGVAAAGDCTIQPHPSRLDAPLIRLESVQNAIDQAQIAAATLLGREHSHAPIPRFWSNQADLRLQTVGISAGWDQLVIRGSMADECFSVLYFSDRELIAADAINSSSDFTACRLALARGAAVTPEAAGSVPDLRALVA